MRRYYERNRDVYGEKNDRMRARLRQLVVEARSVPCMDCGQIYPFFVMDFDHRDRSQKEALISEYVNRICKAPPLAEMAKCDVVCSNCHRIRTYQNGKASGSEYLDGLINSDGREGPQPRFRL